MLNTQSRNMQSQQVDLLLINEISKPSRISQLPSPSNIQQLHKLLKFKNVQSCQSKGTKQRAQQWLNRDGVDISPLVQRVKKVKEITEEKVQLKKVAKDCVYYIQDMDYTKIDRFLSMAQEYGAMNILQKTTHNPHLSSTITRKAINKFTALKNRAPQDSSVQMTLESSSRLGLVRSVKTQLRSMEKAETYLKIITEVGRKTIPRSQLLTQMANTIHRKWWKIFETHVKCINHYNPVNEQDKMLNLLLDTLQMIQEEYDTALGTGGQKIQFYLEKTYLEKLDRSQKRYIKAHGHECFWGKVFVLFQAGRKKDLLNLLSSTGAYTELMQDYNIVYKSIQNRAPVFIRKEYNFPKSDDIFRDQMTFALKGEAKFAHEDLTDPYTLDTAWLLIRNLGIFYAEPDHQAQYKSLRTKLLDRYMQDQNPSTVAMLYNYFYLLAYEEIAQQGVTQIMDQDDYLHFLICLYDNPRLITKSSERIQTLLTQQLRSRINELITQGRSEYIYYMALLPASSLAFQASTLLESSNLVQTFDWNYMRSAVTSKEHFNDLVHQTLQKYMISGGNPAFAAQKYVQLLSSNEDAVKCLLMSLLKTFYTGSFSQMSQNLAQQACERLLNKEQWLKQKYGNMLKFVLQCNRLRELLRQDNHNQIHNLIKSSEFVLLKRVLPYTHHELFSQLIELSSFGLDIYFKYLHQALKGLQVYFSRMHENEQLGDFAAKLGQNVQYIFQHEKYAEFRDRNEATALVQFIEDFKYGLKYV